MHYQNFYSLIIYSGLGISAITQGGHNPGKHGKPEKLMESEKLSKSQGNLREI